MKWIVSILVLFLLGTSVQAMSMERTSEFYLDGDIEFISRAGSPAGEAIFDIRGDGLVEGTTQTTARIDYLQNVTSINVIGGHNLAVIVGVKLANGDEPQIYVSKVTPKYGEKANIGQDIEVDIVDFRTFNIKTDIGTSFGMIQRRINFENEGLTLWEKLDFVGKGWLLDDIIFSIEAE